MLHVRYTASLEDITPQQLTGLHAGWPNPPSPEIHLRSLQQMPACVLAIDDTTDQVVGFICGLTDNTLVLYIWDIEVRAGYPQEEISRTLLAHLLQQYTGIYQVNVITFADRVPLFAQAGFRIDAEQVIGMTITNITDQDGTRFAR